jgi:hypothetical protein
MPGPRVLRCLAVALAIGLNGSDALSASCPGRPPPASGDLLPTAPGSGRHTVSNEGGFTDHFLWGPGDRARIGIRTQWGGAIVYFGLADPSTNTIDDHDTGRALQMAMYDPDRIRQGCAHDASCRKRPLTCPDSISYLGWNPVQGGNKCNQGSPVLNVAGRNGVLAMDVAPLHWNPEWAESACTQSACSRPATSALQSDVRMRQRLRFVDELIVELDLEVTNVGTQAHASTPQEFPTLYSAYGWNRTSNYRVLLDSAGKRIAIDRPANDGFSYKDFVSPGGWVTLQNDSGEYGVGLYAENKLQQWQGWQKARVFNNVRARLDFGLPAQGVVRTRSYLMLGGHGTVAAAAARLDRTLPPFGELEQPARRQGFAGGELAVAGWVLDNTGVREVEILIDGKRVAQAVPGVRRDDVCQKWPGYPQCPRAGFSTNLKLEVTPDCRTLEAVAVDLNGNRRSIGSAQLESAGARAVPMEREKKRGTTGREVAR